MSRVAAQLLQRLRQAINWLASARLLLWLLPALMLLIAAGTVAQKYDGLYVAEKIYFSSFVIWLFGAVPLPGGSALLSLLALSLLLKFLLRSQWRWPRAGINLAHFGVVLLFAGGIVSSLLAQDGSMTIAEGARAQAVHDFHQRDVMLVQGSSLLAALPAEALRAGTTHRLPGLPVRLEIIDACRNCRISARETAGDELRSMARGMQLSANALEKNDEANTGGITFRLTGVNASTDGTYILFEDGPTAKFSVDGQDYELAYGKRQRPLPFTVELKDFVRTNYPGTNNAKAYHSDVIIHDGALSWPARIEMNQPLRYRGYTLYQSAFINTPEKEMTVLAVSHDAGQFIPYLGTLIMGLGLLLHLFIRKAGEAP